MTVSVPDICDVAHKNLLWTNNIQTSDKVLVLAEAMMGVRGSMVRSVRQYQHVVGAHYVEEPVPSYTQGTPSWL